MAGNFRGAGCAGAAQRMQAHQDPGVSHGLQLVHLDVCVLCPALGGVLNAVGISTTDSQGALRNFHHWPRWHRGKEVLTSSMPIARKMNGQDLSMSKASEIIE